MAFSLAFGGVENNRNGQTSGGSNGRQVSSQETPNFPNGNIDLGGTRRVYIDSLAASYASGASGIGYRIGVGSTVYAAGQTVNNALNAAWNFRILFTGGTLFFGRDDNSGGTVVDAQDGGTWAGRLTGTMMWSTVPTIPGTLTAARTGTSVKLTWGNSSSDGGNAANSYYVQYSKDGGAWTGTTAASSGYTYTGLTKGSTYKFRVYLNNDRGNSQARESGNVTIPLDPPAAPGEPTVVRVSDTEQTVSWTRNASATAPVLDQQLQRREYSAGAWGAWAGVNNITTDYTTNGTNSVSNATVANRAYEYRVKASNGSGEAYSPVFSYCFTTPAAPTSFDAEKQTSGDIKLTLVQGISHTFYKTTVEYSLDGGSVWTALTTLNSGVTTYTWTAPPSGSAVVLRARTFIDSAGDPGNGLTSAWKQSNSVALTAPPNAPSNLAPNGLVFDANTAKNFTWKHNPVDSSVQSAYEIQYRIGAAAWTSTGKITSSTQSRTFPAAAFVNGNGYEWQVRTWGAHATASPWSATATFQTSAPPSVTITSPVSGVPWAAAKLTVDWSFNDPEGTAQSMWEAILLDNEGQTIETLSGNGATFTALFATTLTDDTEYQVQVRGRDGSSLWSTFDQISFLTAFPTPIVPIILQAAWDMTTGAATFGVENPVGAPDVIYNDVMRSLDGGQTWQLIGTAPPNGEGFDPTIPLGVDVLYKVVAWTDLPSSSESEVVIINSNYRDGVYVGPVGGYWSAGDNFTTIVRMDKGQGQPPKMDLTSGLANKTLHYFAGRSKPVETVGEATLREGQVEFIVSTVAVMQQARRMAMMPAPHLIRLPDDTTLYCSIEEVEDTRLAEGWYKISFNVTEVDL